MTNTRLPLVSIIIPVYNGQDYISETLQNAISQTWLNKEIIVVDDGSTDNSLRIVQSFSEREVKVISISNGGAARARNIGFANSSGEFIQYLDADDLLINNKIELQMHRLLQDDSYQATLCAGQWIRFNNTIQEAIGGIGPGGRAENDMSPLEWLLLKPYNFMTIHAWLTPAVLIDKAGPWDETMSLDDDGEFFIRVVNASDRVVFCKGALAYYRTVTKKITLSSVSNYSQVSANCMKMQSSYKTLETYKNILSQKSSQGVRQAIGRNILYMAFSSYRVCDEVFDKCMRQKEIPFFQNIVIYRWIKGVFGILALIVGWKLAKRLMIKKYA